MQMCVTQKIIHVAVNTLRYGSARLSPCLFVHSYNPDLDSDPFGEEGSLWSFNYFFYNKKLKRIVFFTFRSVRSAAATLHRWSCYLHTLNTVWSCDLWSLQRPQRVRPWLSRQRAGHGAGRWGGNGWVHWGQVRLALSFCAAVIWHGIIGCRWLHVALSHSVLFPCPHPGASELCACEFVQMTHLGQRVSRLFLFPFFASSYIFFFVCSFLGCHCLSSKAMFLTLDKMHVWSLLFCWQWTVDCEMVDVLSRPHGDS